MALHMVAGLGLGSHETASVHGGPFSGVDEGTRIENGIAIVTTLRGWELSTSHLYTGISMGCSGAKNLKRDRYRVEGSTRLNEINSFQEDLKLSPEAIR